MATKLYGTGSASTSLHYTPDCSRLNGKRVYPIKEFTIDSTHNRRLCKTCFNLPDTVVTIHTRCRICKQKMPLPCPHNGAVLVIAPQVFRLARRPGDHEGVKQARRWVWPENAFKYTLVNPDQPC